MGKHTRLFLLILAVAVLIAAAFAVAGLLRRDARPWFIVINFVFLPIFIPCAWFIWGRKWARRGRNDVPPGR